MRLIGWLGPVSANVSIKLQDIENAILAFRNATSINPGFAIGWNNLGSLLGMLNDWEGAAEAFDAGIEADPNYAKNHFGRGNPYL